MKAEVKNGMFPTKQVIKGLSVDYILPIIVTQIIETD